MSEPKDDLVERLRFPWEKMGATAAPKIARILKERKEAADRIEAQAKLIERLICFAEHEPRCSDNRCSCGLTTLLASIKEQ